MAHTDITMISIETTTKLLKLHLKWPERRDWNGKPEQALEFYKWLFLNHHQRPEVMALEDLDVVEEFLGKNKHVLWPPLSEEEKWANLRLEPRIENDVNINLTVHQCDDAAQIGRIISGRTLDIGLHGMRITISELIPEGARLMVEARKDEDSAKVYQLVGESRWSVELEDGFLIGVQLEEDEGFEVWQADFGAEFVKPVLGRGTRTDHG